MGRFLVIVLALIGIGLIVNYLSSGKKQEQPATPAIEVEAGPQLKPAENAAEPATAESSAVEELPAEKATPAGEAASEATESTSHVAEESAALPEPATPAAASEEPAAEVAPETTPPPAETTVAAAEPALPPESPAATEVPLTAEAPAVVAEEEVFLGTAELTKGISGTGSLTIDEIKSWLDESKNHAVLKPVLPLGLAAAAGQIVGIDANPLTRAKIELGRQLFFDPRLSSDGTISCASCHHPDFGYAKDTQFGVGVNDQTGNRNSPVAYNRLLSGLQFWDGRAASLEEQAKGPIANPIEMANTHEVCISQLVDHEGYRIQFEKIFPDGVTIDNVANAIACFERALATGPAPWDYYEQLKNFEEGYATDIEDLEALKSDEPDLYNEYMALKAAADEHPLSDSAKRGGELFFSDRAACTACHVGANFSDEQYHNLGVGMDAAEPDLGRYVVTKEEKDQGAFKTPTVRNIDSTGPYMHDGSQKTLEEVVAWYNKGGHPNAWLSEKIKPLNLTDQEQADLVAFMKALTGPLPTVEQGRLPE